MSMEVRVFIAGEPPAGAVLNQALRDLGVDLAIADPATALGAYGGFMPMRRGTGDDAEETGVEVYVGSAGETIAEFGIDGIDLALDREVSFRWGGDALEGACAYALAAAIAEVTGGVVYDDEEGRIMTIADATAVSRDLMKSV